MCYRPIPLTFFEKQLSQIKVAEYETKLKKELETCTDPKRIEEIEKTLNSRLRLEMMTELDGLKNIMG